MVLMTTDTQCPLTFAPACLRSAVLLHSVGAWAPCWAFVLGRKDADSVGGSQREDRQSGGFALG